MKARLNIFGQNYAGTWARDKEIETEIVIRGNPPPGELQRRKRLAMGTEADRAELRSLPPIETQVTELPFTQSYFIFKTDAGTVYCIARDRRNPRREDYPVAVVGVRESPSAFMDIRAGTGAPASVKCARIRFADGFEETASFTVTQTAPAEKIEIETHFIAAETEKLILSECDTNTAFRTLKAPTMREFYIEYVQGRDSIKAIATRTGWSERTIKSRKSELEGAFRHKHGRTVDLYTLKHDPLLKEARRSAEKGLVEKLTKAELLRLKKARRRDRAAQEERNRFELLEEKETRRRNEREERRFSAS